MALFKKGDVVKLKSGGPKMTITGNSIELLSRNVLPNKYNVTWFNVPPQKDDPQYREFDEEVLELDNE